MANKDPLLLFVNGTYTTLEVALMHQDKLWRMSTQHIFASTQLIPLIQQLCSPQGYTLKDITAFAINVGPGPFTTLRTIITTINGIHYATKTPLIGINGIEAWAQFEHSAEFTHTFALLNAFCNDVYYAYYDAATQSMASGCCSLSYWLQTFHAFLEKHPHARIKTIGNGFTMHTATIAQEMGAEFINMSVHEAPPLEALIPAAQLQWQEQVNISSQLTPLYLKNYTPHKK